MKVLILSSACCIHTRKWCNGLAQKGLDVHLVSQQVPMEGYSNDVTFHKLPYQGLKGYFLNGRALKKVIKKINPDVVNVHYASGYGTLASIAGLKNFIMSVWGSDVYDFPFTSPLHHKLVNYNLNRSSVICSTSEVMGEFVANNFSLKKNLSIQITPFGVDVSKFKKKKLESNKTSFVIGTVKTLRPKYGIDNLIKAFAFLVNKGHNNISLRIAGKGFMREQLEELTRTLGVSDKVEFLGWVENDKVPSLLNTFDVYVAPSTLDSESFGVAIVEASSCELPVIVTRVGGLPEVVIDNKTGIVVEPNDIELLSDAMEALINDQNLCSSLGETGRKHVIEKYEWNYCVDKMISIYDKYRYKA
ncbi:glycosyltransferase [Escherichia coli]|nr:glycosyltransferase [Escherichia coli]